MYNLYSCLIILIFVSRIGVSDNSENDGLKNQNEPIVNFNSYQRVPLKVILLNDINAVNYVLPFSPSSKQSSIEAYFYLCPMIKNDIYQNTSGELKRGIETTCLKPVNAKNENAAVCDEAFTFSITSQVEENFPNVDVFVFGYDVCDVDFVDKTIGSTKLELYKVYVNRITKQALHTEHQILSGTEITPPDFETYMPELKLTHYEDSLKELPTAYINLQQPKPKSKKNILHSIFSKMSSTYKAKLQRNTLRNKHVDYLIPQMLVPYTDLEPLSSRGANFDYLNIRPQYKRLRTTWNSINKIIWENLNSHQLTGSIKIYTSASNILMHKKKEVKIHVDKNLQISVPSFWWHLIKTDDGKAIIILLHNVPLDYPLKKVKFCGTRCSETGWNLGIFDLYWNIFVECCEASEELLKNFGFIKYDMQIKGMLFLNNYKKTETNKKQENEQTEDGEKIIDATVSDTPLTESTTDSTLSTDVDLPSTDSIVQGCSENISDDDCIHLDPTENAIERCPTEAQPNIVTSDTPCAGEGILYTFQYKVCHNTSVEDDEVKFAETLMLYSVCYDKNKKETIYAVHKILTNEPSSVDLNANIYIKQLKTYVVQIDVQQDLQNMAITYEKYLRENLIVPQMLAPSIDMDQSYAMGANFHYLNIRPQYKRIADRWNEINKKILQHLFDNELNKDVIIHTGTSLQLPNSSIKHELPLDENYSISIPMAWGKIITLKSKSIVILIYNIPFKHYFETEQRFCESICNKTNWFDIESDQKKKNFNVENIHVQCCETTEQILNYFRLSHLWKEIGEIGREFEILELPRKFTPLET